MIHKVPFIRSDAQALQTSYILRVLADPNAFWSNSFLRECGHWFENKYGGSVTFLDSCTEAVNAVTMISDLKSGDEVIVPSFTHVSTILPFVNRGIIPVFVDVSAVNFCLEILEVEKAITSKTKMVIAVNYGGWATDYNQLKELCRNHQLLLMEDNAQGLGAMHNGQSLGIHGDFSVFSFERQKNISCQEGGALVVHNEQFRNRATEVVHLGTNRTEFEEGHSAYYEWVSEGIKATFTEFQAAYLLPQLLKIEAITLSRKKTWEFYYDSLLSLSNWGILVPNQHEAQHNGHIFYLILRDQNQRNDLKQHLAKKNIEANFHYYPLHLSKMGRQVGRHTSEMKNTLSAGLNLLRLPLFNGISKEEQEYVIAHVYSFFKNK